MERRTLADLAETTGDFLRIDDVAAYLGTNPQSIRAQAHDDPRQLGFRCCVIGSRIWIPKASFISYWGGTV